MRKFQFETGNYYHIYNRGVDKRVIFQDKQDYYRFLHYFYVFNEADTGISIRRQIHNTKNQKAYNATQHILHKRIKQTAPLVDILCFCLIPNHFHIIAKQVIDGGVSKFMLRVGAGYGMYFNLKNKRTGALFEGRFKAIHIKNDEYLLHLSRYIHLNPVKLIKPNWKEKGILKSEWGEIKDFLEKYKWSSYLDYIGKKNLPSIINKSVIQEQFRDARAYEEFVTTFMAEELDLIKDLLKA